MVPPIKLSLRVLGACTAVHVAFSLIYVFVLPAGRVLPPAFAVMHVAAMIFMAGFHSVHHIGARPAGIFFGMMVVLEWLAEQINISGSGWVFGHVIYDDHLVGPKLGDVPIIVPIAFAALVWPTFVMVNLLLEQRVVVLRKREGLGSLAWRCALYALVHTAWSFAIEPTCMATGLYRYDRLAGTAGTFFGVPMSELRGWAILAFIQFFAYARFIAPRLAIPEPKPVDLRIDVTPFLLYGGFALFLVLKPVDPAIGAVTLWTMGFYMLASAYRLAAAHRDARAREPRAAGEVAYAAVVSPRPVV